MMWDKVGVGLGPRSRISEDQRQNALSAAAVLQLMRTDVARALGSGGTVTGAEIVARGGDGTNEWMMRAAHDWRELLSVRPAATVTQLRVSLPNNRAILRDGIRMISAFDYDGVDGATARLLAAETEGTYVVGVAPVQMKLVDRDQVLLQGPSEDDGEPTIMAVRAPAVLEAAWRYWEAVVGSCRPITELSGLPVGLTPRQHQVVVLLATDTGDDAIAAALGVSVRTVRSDIAEVMRVLGVKSRFAAGMRLHELERDEAG